MAKYLDENGLLYLWQQLKIKLAGKVDAEAGKGLSANDYTTEEKTKLAGIADGANQTVVNTTLTSASDTEALAASQGKALKERLDALESSMGDFGGGDMLKSTYDADGDGVVDNAKQLDGKGAENYALADGTNLVSVFTPADVRENLASGESLSAVLGKIAKYFSDLKAVAFSSSYGDLSDTPAIPTVTNDLTDELKAVYDAAYAHSQVAHAPADAQANVIESISVNGAVQMVDAKGVNIVVPTTVAALSDSGQYAKKADLTNLYRYKGSITSVTALPLEGNTAGDVYNVEDTGMNYAWTGTAWDALGQVFSVDAITNTEIDAILAA